MKTILKVALLLVVLAFAVSCSSIQPLTATSNPVGSKTGEATATFFLGLPMGGADYSIQRATLEGRISKVSTVDVKTSIGFLVIKYTTIVTGE